MLTLSLPTDAGCALFSGGRPGWRRWRAQPATSSRFASRAGACGFRCYAASAMPPIRRLPVLQNTETTDPERPPWHWIIIGFSFIVSLFAPLAMLATWVGQRVALAFFGDATSGELALRLAAASRGARAAMWFAAVGAPVLAYIFSCFGAGMLVGRFGARAGPQEAAGAGGVAGLTLWGLVFLRGSEASPGVGSSAAPGAVLAAVALVVLVSLGGVTSYAGGRLGFRLRTASATRPVPHA